MESSGRIKKTNSQPVAYIDLSQDTTESLAKDSQVTNISKLVLIFTK